MYSGSLQGSIIYPPTAEKHTYYIRNPVEKQLALFFKREAEALNKIFHPNGDKLVNNYLS
jgi:hypothetical protein